MAFTYTVSKNQKWPPPQKGGRAGAGQVKSSQTPPTGGKKTMTQTKATPSTSKTGPTPRSLAQKQKGKVTEETLPQTTTTAQSNKTTQGLLPRPDNPPTRIKKTNVSLRKLNNKDVIERKDVYKLLCENNVIINHVYNTPSGFTVKMDNPRSVDQILSDKIADKLKASLNLVPNPPPQHLSQRSVVVRGIDEVLGGNSAEAIKDEIIKNNADLNIESVIKFGGMTRTFKIICKDTATAETICREGFKAFYYNVSTSQVEQEVHVKLNTCTKCYMHNNHNTNQCKSTIKICSECAETGHIWRDCKKTVKKCINCTREGNEAEHRTLAMKCPIAKALRKKVLKQRAESKRNVGTTYAAAAAGRDANREAPKTQKPSAPAPKPVQIVMNNDLSVKMTALILEAHISSINNDAKFSELLSENIKLNYGVDVKFPERDSQGIFRMLSTKDQQPEEHNATSEANTLEPATQKPSTQESNPRKRAVSPEVLSLQAEPLIKKKRGEKKLPALPDSSLSSTGQSEEENSVIEMEGNGKTRSPTPRASTPTKSPAPKKISFKVLATELPKTLTGSEVFQQIFGNTNPRYKLVMERPEDIKEEKHFLQLLKQNRFKIKPDDILRLSPKTFKKRKPLSYE